MVARVRITRLFGEAIPKCASMYVEIQQPRRIRSHGGQGSAQTETILRAIFSPLYWLRPRSHSVYQRAIYPQSAIIRLDSI